MGLESLYNERFSSRSLPYEWIGPRYEAELVAHVSAAIHSRKA